MAIAPSPLTGGNRIGNRQYYLWIVKDGESPGGMRFMQKHGAPPNNPEDGQRVAAMCNDAAMEQFGLGQVAEVDQETGRHTWRRTERITGRMLGQKAKHRFYEGQVESVPSKDGELFNALEDVHVLSKETQQLFKDRVFAAEKIQESADQDSDNAFVALTRKLLERETTIGVVTEENRHVVDRSHLVF